MRNMQNGFTLIELMIVVAIIGILAAIAIPQYQDYIARTQVNRVLSEIASLKTAAKMNLTHGILPADAVADLSFTSSNLMNGSVPAVDFSAGDGSGTIVATMGNDAATNITDATVTLQRTASGIWNCIVDGSAAPGWKPNYTPAGCVNS